jgi:hypothetical protein
MLFEHPASIEERWLDIFRELGEPEAILACTFTLHADFFTELLSRFAEAACQGVWGTGRTFDCVPVDVVCDKSRYFGHHLGFNVKFWPKIARLFHPKLFIVLFDQEVVWSDGSLNLTPAGWRRNREIAMLHRPGRRVLPGQLRDLLEALPGAVAATQILKATVSTPTEKAFGRFLTSLHQPIGPRFLAGAPKRAEEVHLVAPFFEKEESNEKPIDEKWLQQLTHRYSNAKFHIYLPQLEADPLRVQGTRKLFDAAERILKHPIILHPVKPKPGPLHGKLLCIVHKPKRKMRAYVLVGSANMTAAALLTSRDRGNIELAWILDTRWQDTKQLLHALGSKGRPIADAEFIEPSLDHVNTWMPLRGAVYDPLHRRLKLDWKQASDKPCTALRYADCAVSATVEGLVQPFDLVDGIAWLVTHRRGGGSADGFCPIEVPVDLLPACTNLPMERTPEDWLKLLGSISAEPVDGIGRKHSTNGKGKPIQDTPFPWSERVRDLAAHMRYVTNAFCQDTLNPVEKTLLLKLVEHIYDEHDPHSVPFSDNEAWRAWLRLELWQTAKKLSVEALLKQDRESWRRQARRLRRRIKPGKLSPDLGSQFSIVLKALGDST